MSATKPKRRKQTHRERGYVPRIEAAAALRDIAERLERPHDGNLVKFSINVWLASEDQPELIRNRIPNDN